MEIQINNASTKGQQFYIFDTIINDIDFSVAQIVFKSDKTILVSKNNLSKTLLVFNDFTKEICLDFTNIDAYDSYFVYSILVELVNKNIKTINIIGNKDILQESKRLFDNYALLNKLIFMPPNILTPEYFEQIVQDFFANDNLSIKSYTEKEIEDNFKGLEAVSRGSNHPPKLIHIKQKSNNEKPIVIVAKGVTFDAGGFNLKKGNMYMSKVDMSGCAHAILTFNNLLQTGYSKNIELILLICENQISSKMLLPGEVISYVNSIDVEVTNCDAEGRLILADGLLLAGESNPSHIIDIATLTGSAGASFGNEITPMMGTSKHIKNLLSNSYNDYYIELPLIDNYIDKYKSINADIINHVEGDAGCLMGGLFLKHFIADNQWIHFDIAATTLAPNGQRANENFFIDLSDMIVLLAESE